jgi:hypothetical protein
MLTSSRYTLAPSFIEKQKAVKNPVELQGFRNAYARDAAAMVCPSFSHAGGSLNQDDHRFAGTPG